MVHPHSGLSGFQERGYDRFLAPGEAACPALEATFFVGEEAAAIRTLTGNIFHRSVADRFDYRIGSEGGVFTVNLLFENGSDSVGAGKYRLAFFPGDRRTANALELFHNRRDFNAGAKGKRNQPADRFELSGSTAAGFPQHGEDFADTVFIRIHGDIRSEERRVGKECR